ncbi:hypothetical protein [Pseudomonas fluorescens]|uniref:Uncharacterized protein n=1 Tax=Pseudomonas fluorescens TaxID=294 RepID=A0A5E6RIB7_PSEFL|nr:hypothetical protein [Pseudomonas fluorescens]VVM68367.1 hypothetical protein PS624_01672 [Pseudomonas fluorescens]
MRTHSIPNFVFFAVILLSLAASTAYFSDIGLREAWVELNENQIMYLYSTSAQVLAAVYGLTLAGYIFFRGELNREAQDDETRVESIERLEIRYFQQLSMITALVMSTILITNLVIAYENTQDSRLLTILMNLGQSLFAIAFVAIAFFIVDIVLPGNIKAASRTLQNKIDPNHNVEEGQGSLKEFISVYNTVQNELTAALKKQEVLSDSDMSRNAKRITNTRMAEFLYRRGVITRELCKKLQNLFALRHAIIHGADPTVSQVMVNQSQVILDELRNSLVDAVA